MTILVTGSSGRIGCVVAALLTEHGHTVRPFDLPDHNLCDFAAVSAAVEGVDAVAHLGAIPSPRDGFERQIMETNVQGSWNVLEACVAHGVKRVVAYSSVNGFGSFGVGRPVVHLPGGDDYPPGQFNIYQLSKYLMEETCRYYAAKHGMTILCPRPMFVSSPEHYEHFVKNKGTGVDFDLFGYVDIRDVAEATRLALELPDLSGYHAFLLSADDTARFEPTAEVAAQYFPNTPWRIPMDDWLAENPHRALIDTTVAKTLLGWQPKYSWREAL